MEIVLGVDLGTSYFKLGLFDCDGKLHGLGRVAVETDKGDGTRCELPTERFWAALREGLRSALEQASADAEDIVALAYSSQANTFVLLDENHQPLTPLILWSDRRVSEADPAVTRIWQRDDFSNIAGLGIGESPELAVAKLKWFQREQPEIWAKTNRIMTISDYFTCALTGKPVGDASTASLLGIVDVQQLKWWDDALDLLGLSVEQLSQPLRPGTAVGCVSTEGAKCLGVSCGIPFCVGGLDHYVAAVGAGVGTIAPLSESTGTVLACLGLTDLFEPAENVSVGPGHSDCGYYRFAFGDNGAGALEWYQEKHAPQSSIAELVELAQSVPPGCDGLIALPCPQKHSQLEGFKNRAAIHRPAHFARAIMESVAASLRDLVDDLCPQGRPERIVATGGGAVSDLWLQIKADLLGVEFVRTQCHEPACQGAAMFAAVAAGWFDDLYHVGSEWAKVVRSFVPSGS